MKRFICCFFIATVFLYGQGLEYIKANYAKYEFQIPMRDGIKLFASVYVPKDDSQTWPIMFDRTPYSVAPYGVDNLKPHWARPSCLRRISSSSCMRMCAER